MVASPSSALAPAASQAAVSSAAATQPAVSSAVVSTGVAGSEAFGEGSDEDAAIVDALRAGDADAADRLFLTHGEHVQRVLARVLGPDPDLVDLIQDVFVTALTSFRGLKDPRALRPWLTTIAVFTARARIRKRARWSFFRFLPHDELPEQTAPSTPAEVSEALRCTYRVLGRMPAQERIPFALRVIDGMELTQVAEACGFSLATVKRRLSRAKQRFCELAREEPALSDWLDERTSWEP
jgi:RNA polymerase sigma-70 factor, ECF subfamily